MAASMDSMNSEEKKRSVGLCCFSLLGLVSTAAFICAVYSYAYCDFATRYIELTEGTDPNTVCETSGFSTDLQPVCEALIQTHGVGFEGFWVTVPVDQQVCFPYTQPTPIGIVTPTFDTKFNSARALSITGIVLGGAAWFTLMLASCCPLDQARMKGLSCYFFLATLFQGLSLLLFRSNVCDVGFFSAYFSSSTVDQVDFIESVSCGLSTGSRLAISATVLWFVCNSMVPMVVVPTPLTMLGRGQAEPAVAAAAGTAEEEA
ncbi:hypothetical protein IV203_019040 [Nitzschia inconspicua]|uniref:Transmembrane protein n=1 Tax=Nitzschia inconspicua TaxID=303405 RepID=A0A9K3KJ28_9STRA|nr:hypothetical protein IV203_022637 [Nitzschia inconspicua]KAG7370470.1 hypothetical protein IV203_019040 [Nitzschia inconspicua]